MGSTKKMKRVAFPHQMGDRYMGEMVKFVVPGEHYADGEARAFEIPDNKIHIAKEPRFLRHPFAIYVDADYCREHGILPIDNPGKQLGRRLHR